MSLRSVSLGSVIDFSRIKPGAAIAVTKTGVVVIEAVTKNERVNTSPRAASKPLPVPLQLG